MTAVGDLRARAKRHELQYGARSTEYEVRRASPPHSHLVRHASSSRTAAIFWGREWATQSALTVQHGRNSGSTRASNWRRSASRIACALLMSSSEVVRGAGSAIGLRRRASAATACLGGTRSRSSNWFEVLGSSAERVMRFAAWWYASLHERAQADLLRRSRESRRGMPPRPASRRHRLRRRARRRRRVARDERA